MTLLFLNDLYMISTFTHIMKNSFITAPTFVDVNNIFQDLSGLIYPEICSGCGGRLMQQETTICFECLYNLPQTYFHQSKHNPVTQRLSGRIDFEQATAMYFFAKNGKVKDLIHELKYRGKYQVGVVLGEQLGKVLNKQSEWETIDCIVPVPLHPKRLRQRGYNQSLAIVEGIGNKMNVSIETQMVKRVVDNSSQTKKKDTTSRWDNVKDIFKVNRPTSSDYQHFLIVDDVITTGSTVEACAIAIKAAMPTAKISFASVACAEIF